MRPVLPFSVVALAAMATPCAAQTGAGYPAVAVLDAVRATCATPATPQSVLAAGWTRAADPGATPVGELLAFGRSAGAKMLEGVGKLLDEPSVYQRTVAGESLYLILSGVQTGDTVVRGCRIYDPGETREIAVPVAASWVKRAATRTVDQPELRVATWEPGFAAGQDSFQLFFVPAGSPAMSLTKVSGLAFKVDWVDQPASGDRPTGTEEKK